MWLFDNVDIKLHRYCYQQVDQGEQVNAIIDEKQINTCLLTPGDLIFTKGVYGFQNKRLKKKVGHVGLFTGESVIHATWKGKTVIEQNLDEFLEKRYLRDVRRYLTNSKPPIV